MKIGTFDLEADSPKALEVENVWCIVVKDHSTGKRYSYNPDDIRRGISHLSEFDVLVGHNCIAYDFPVLRNVYGWEFEGKKVDTLIMSRTQRPNRKAPPNCPNKNQPHGVEAWGYRLGHNKVEHNEWDKFSPEMLIRCEEDVEIQYQIYEELLKEAKGEGWMPAHRLNMKLFDYLQIQSEKGWYVDKPHMEHCIHTLDRWVEKIDRSVHPYLPIVIEVLESKKNGEYNFVRKPFLKSGHRAEVTKKYFDDDVDVGGPFTRIKFRKVDLDSNKETKDVLLGMGWKPTEFNTNNVGERTSPKLSLDDKFEGIQGSLGKLIVKRVQCRHRRSTIQGWLDNIRPDGTISPDVRGIASTGRIRHGTIVNVPSPASLAFFAKQMRQCFIARDGMVIVGADSAGNQIRQLAARMDDEDFKHAVLFGNKEDGTDLHSLNQKRSGVKSRTEAKNFFYGFIFGAQDNKIGQIIGKGKQEGKLLREKYLQEVPKLGELINQLTEQWRKSAKQKWWNPRFGKWEFRDGFIKGLDGRPVLVDTEHKILNYQLQSDEAIQMAYAYVLVHEWMEERGYELGKHWNMLIWYHDEFQAECLPEIKDELGQLMCDAIEEAGKFFEINCPHGGEYEVGKSWYDTH